MTTALCILAVAAWYMFCRAAYYRQVFGRWVIKLREDELDRLYPRRRS